MINSILHYLCILQVFFVLGQERPKFHQKFFKDGSIRYEWYTQNHHPVKYWKTYFKDKKEHYHRTFNVKGKVVEEGWFFNNTKKNFWIENKTNKSKGQGFYKNNLKTGLWKFYTKKHLDSIGEYKLGKPIGEWLYYQNKKLVLKKNYLENSKNYTIKEFHQNGVLKTQGKYINHKKIGYWKEFSPNNILLSSGSFINGLKDGYWHFYSNDGSLLEKGNFKFGKKDQWWLFYNKDGSLSKKCELKENLLNGYCIHYVNGKIVKGQYYKKGIKTKEWNTWSSFRKDYKKLNE